MRKSHEAHGYWGADQGRLRVPRPAPSPLIEQLDQTIQTLASLAARPQFHTMALERAGLTTAVFPDHPARSIDPALYGVLLAIEADPWLGPSSLAARLGLHPSTVCHHLARLEERSIITRRRTLPIARSAVIRFTEPGILGFETVRDARHAMLEEVALRHGDGRASRLVACLAGLTRDVRDMHAARTNTHHWC